jgi:hypothetical protein
MLETAQKSSRRPLAQGWIETVLAAARLHRANVLMLDALRYA